MTQITDLFDLKILFSKENPLLKSAENTHRRIFETFDKTARLQLSFAEDLLELNRKRFEALYAGDSLLDKVTAHQDLATEIGKRTVTLAGDLQEIAVDLRSDVSDAANELISPVTAKTPAAKPRKAKPKKAGTKKAGTKNAKAA
jgi:hypothetical protein